MTLVRESYRLYEGYMRLSTLESIHTNIESIHTNIESIHTNIESIHTHIDFTRVI